MSLQETVYRGAVRDLVRGARTPIPPVHLVKYRGKLYLWDGNHPTAAAQLLGQTTIRAEVFDLDVLLTRLPATNVQTPAQGPQHEPGPLYLPR